MKGGLSCCTSRQPSASFPGDSHHSEPVLLQHHGPSQQASAGGPFLQQEKKRLMVSVDLKVSTIEIKLKMFHRPHYGQSLLLYCGITVLTREEFLAGKCHWELSPLEHLHEG